MEYMYIWHLKYIKTVPQKQEEMGKTDYWIQVQLINYYVYKECEDTNEMELGGGGEDSDNTGLHTLLYTTLDSQTSFSFFSPKHC